jgi:hypothetical protein
VACPQGRRTAIIFYPLGHPSQYADGFPQILDEAIGPNELEMRLKLAQLQRQYKEKKKELDKLVTFHYSNAVFHAVFHICRLPKVSLGPAMLDHSTSCYYPREYLMPYEPAFLFPRKARKKMTLRNATP